MALEAELTESARRLANVIHDLARTWGWAPGSYRIAMELYMATGTPSIQVFTDHVQGLSEEDGVVFFDDVMDVYEKQYAENLGFYQRIGLSFWPLRMAESLNRGTPDPDWVSVPASLINPSSKGPRRRSRKPAATPDRP